MRVAAYVPMLVWLCSPSAAAAHHWVAGVEHGSETVTVQASEGGAPQGDVHDEALPGSPGPESTAPGALDGAADPQAPPRTPEWQPEDEPSDRAAQRANERMLWAAEIYEDLTTASDAGVPERLLEQTRCIALVPQVVKGAFFFGARYGKGVLTCRNDAGEWSPPVFITLAGPSFGFQWGAQSADVALFFRRESGVRRLLESRLTLGGDASVAAGPVGRRASAEVDVTLTTDILSYARSRGAFLGISLEGSYLGVDDDANAAYYGRDVEPAALLFEHRIPAVPQSASKLLALLP